jgi:putative ABC transport system ATP-binding protein
MTVYDEPADQVDDPMADDLVDPATDELDEDEHTTVPEGALVVLRRGLRQSPELLQGLVATVALGVLVAAGKLTVPIVIQRALDRPPRADGSIDLPYIVTVAAVATAVVIVAGVLARWAQLRLIHRAELAIANLRVAAFEHVHRLSMADHNETKRGILVARVTSDIDSLARFVQWGLFSWSVSPIVVLGILVVLFFYSWQLGLLVLLTFVPIVPGLRWVQLRQVEAYDRLRTAVGNMLGVYSEAVTGAAVIRAYGAEDRTRASLDRAVDRRYRTRVDANKYMAGVFVVGDVIGAFTLCAVLAIGVWQRDAWGLSLGTIVSALFLTNMLLAPISELSETLDSTQTAVAGWRKVLNLLDRPVEIGEPDQGMPLASGPVRVDAVDVGFSYRDGDPVLRDVSLTIPAGANVAVVGATGSGKTTFAKLLCRLADPVEGRIELNGVDLRQVSPSARLSSVRMVPQDGFLFNDTVGTNVSFGRNAAAGPGSDGDGTDGSQSEVTVEQIEDAFERLGLGWWLAKLPDGLDTEVGDRGENLSVGERQLVALARAQLADPGLLILDEATSAVDPETDQALTIALRRLAEGRTMVSIAHRLATAEAADLILVFDKGRVVERGPHQELVDAGGVYTGLHRAWIGNTQTTA